MAPTSFSAQDVQGKLEDILKSGNRQVAARCALLCAEFAEAAREDERSVQRERQSRFPAASTPARRSGEPAAFSAGAWSRGFYGDSLVRPREEKDAEPTDSEDEVCHSRSFSLNARSSVIMPPDILKRQPTIDRLAAENTSDRDCEWILRAAFAMRNKVRRLREISEYKAREEEVSMEAEQATSSRSIGNRRASLAGTELDPQLQERIINFRNMVRLAVGLWQDKLLDDDPGISRSVTDFEPGRVEKVEAVGGKWKAKTTTAVPEGPRKDSQEEAKGQSPYRNLLTPKSQPVPVPPASGHDSPHRPAPRSLGAQMIGQPTSDRSSSRPVSPSKVLSPTNRRELHEELGRELAQLAEDLRNAQIISSH